MTVCQLPLDLLPTQQRMSVAVFVQNYWSSGRTGVFAAKHAGPCSPPLFPTFWLVPIMLTLQRSPSAAMTHHEL